MVTVSEKKLSDIPFYSDILRLLNARRNVMIIIVGPTGTGKSYLAMKLASRLDKTFNVKDRVISTPKEFLEKVVEGKMKKGQSLIMDEAGTLIPSREWQSFNNRAIGMILQTWRHRRLICIWTVPSLDFVDVQARKLFNFYLETIGVRFREKKVCCRVFKTEYSSRFDKIYFKKIRKGGVVYDPFYFSKPEERHCKAYEKKAKKFKNELAKTFLEESRARESKEEAKKPADENKIIDEIVKDVKEHLEKSELSPYIFRDKRRIAINKGRVLAEYGIGVRCADRVRSKAILQLEREGLTETIRHM